MISGVWEGQTIVNHSEYYKKTILERYIPNYKNRKLSISNSLTIHLLYGYMCDEKSNDHKNELDK